MACAVGSHGRGVNSSVARDARVHSAEVRSAAAALSNACGQAGALGKTNEVNSRPVFLGVSG